MDTGGIVLCFNGIVGSLTSIRVTLTSIIIGEGNETVILPPPTDPIETKGHTNTGGVVGLDAGGLSQWPNTSRQCFQRWKRGFQEVFNDS